MMSSKLVSTFFLVPAVAQRKCEARLDRLMGRRCLRSGSTAVVKHVKVQSTPGMLLKVGFSTFAGLPAAALPHFKSWTIAARLIAIVIALALPLNLGVIAVIWNLNRAANDASRARLSVVVSAILIGNVAKEWVADVYVPIFKNDQPFRTLAVTMKVRGFLKLLNAREIPENWKVGIIDGQGRFIARVPDHDAFVGELASQGWRDVKDQDGIFEFFHSSEGDVVANASAHPTLSGWTVGVAVKKSELQAAALNAVCWAIALGIAISLLSLGLAVAIARRITRPIAEMGDKAAMALSGGEISFEPDLPELGALWSALKQAVADRNHSDAARHDSERQLAPIVTSSQAAIVSTTLDGAITSWNAAAQRPYGYAAKEMLGQSVRRLLPATRH